MKYLLLTFAFLFISCDDFDRNEFSYFEDSNYNYEFRIDGYFLQEYINPLSDSSNGIIYFFENGLFYMLNQSVDLWDRNSGGCFILNETNFNSISSWGTFQVLDSNIIIMEKKENKTNNIGDSPFLILEGKYLINKEVYDNLGFGDMTPQEIQEESPIHIFEFFPCTDKPDSSRSHIYRHFKGD